MDVRWSPAAFDDLVQILIASESMIPEPAQRVAQTIYDRAAAWESIPTVDWHSWFAYRSRATIARIAFHRCLSRSGLQYRMRIEISITSVIGPNAGSPVSYRPPSRKLITRYNCAGSRLINGKPNALAISQPNPQPPNPRSEATNPQPPTPGSAATNPGSATRPLLR